MPDSGRQFVSRRAFWVSFVIAAAILAGVLLFLRFAGDMDPLLGSAWTTTILHA